jgi:tocopherol O-methyltransferase
MMPQPARTENPAPAPHARRVVSFYGRLHPEYHRFRKNDLPPAMHFGFWDERTGSYAEAQTNMNRALAERAAIQTGDRVLDAGCGAGHSATWLAGELGVRVVGVNLVPGQIYTAHRCAYLLGLSHLLSFERRDFTRTGFPEESFDVVWALESVCHTPEKEGFLVEANRLLKPGGRLVVADLFRTGRSFEPEEERLMQSWLSGWAIPDLATAGEFEEAVYEAGFVSVTVEDATVQVWPSLLRMYRLGSVGYPVARFLKGLRLYDDRWLAGARSCVDQFHALRRDLWLYGVFTARKSERRG